MKIVAPISLIAAFVLLALSVLAITPEELGLPQRLSVIQQLGRPIIYEGTSMQTQLDLENVLIFTHEPSAVSQLRSWKESLASGALTAVPVEGTLEVLNAKNLMSVESSTVSRITLTASGDNLHLVLLLPESAVGPFDQLFFPLRPRRVIQTSPDPIVEFVGSKDLVVEFAVPGQMDSVDFESIHVIAFQESSEMDDVEQKAVTIDIIATPMPQKDGEDNSLFVILSWVIFGILVLTVTVYIEQRKEQ